MDAAKRDHLLLKDVRGWLGLTQSEVAQLVGVSASLIGLIEQGRYPLDSPACDKVWNGFISNAKGAIENNSPGTWEKIVAGEMRRPASGFAFDPFSFLRVVGALPPRGQSSADDEQIRRIWEEKKALLEYVARLEENASLFKKILALQDAELASKEADKQKLRAKIAELRELYEIGTTAVVSQQRYSELKEKIERESSGGS